MHVYELTLFQLQVIETFPLILILDIYTCMMKQSRLLLGDMTQQVLTASKFIWCASGMMWPRGYTSTH